MSKQKIKTKPEIHTCWKCGTTFVLKYKEKWKREKRAKENNRPVDLDICGECGKKHYRIYEIKKRYGCEHALQNPESMAKRNQTMINRYGTDVAMHVEEFVERQKATNLERYGYEVSSKNKEVKEKAKATNLERYGVVSTALVPEIKQKQIDTLLKNHGTTSLFSITHPGGSKLEQKFLKLISDYIIDNNLNLRVYQEVFIFGKYYDFVIKNPDGSINSLVECDGLYYHGYKTGYDGMWKGFENAKITNKSRSNRDSTRLYKAYNHGCKIFIIRETEDLEVNMEDFDLLVKNVLLSFKEWVFEESMRINIFYENITNSMNHYHNFIDFTRRQFLGFTPFDINRNGVNQDKEYLYKKRGATPFDIVPEEDYVI